MFLFFLAGKIHPFECFCYYACGNPIKDNFILPLFPCYFDNFSEVIYTWLFRLKINQRCFTVHW